MWIERGDTGFTRSSSLLGRLIRWGERDPTESPSWANHMFVVVESGWTAPLPGDDNGAAVVVEALGHVRRGPLKLNGVAVRVFRPNPPYTEEEKQRFIVAANNYVGDRYGWWKLTFHLADRLFFGGRKVLSRLLFIDKRPICSYLAAKVNDHARAIGTINVIAGVKIPWPEFVVPPQAVDPDEALDFCESQPAFWTEIR